MMFVMQSNYSKVLLRFWLGVVLLLFCPKKAPGCNEKCRFALACKCARLGMEHERALENRVWLMLLLLGGVALCGALWALGR